MFGNDAMQPGAFGRRMTILETRIAALEGVKIKYA